MSSYPVPTNNDSFRQIDNHLIHLSNLPSVDDDSESKRVPQSRFTHLLKQTIQGNLTTGIVNFTPVWWRGTLPFFSTTEYDNKFTQSLHLQSFTVLLSFVAVNLLATFKMEGILEFKKQSLDDYLPLISIVHYELLGNHHNSNKIRQLDAVCPFLFQPKISLVKTNNIEEYEVSVQIMWQQLNLAASTTDRIHNDPILCTVTTSSET